MAEEDLIFGKNRHFFGGIEPSTMIKLATYISDGVVYIDAQLPKDTVVNNQTLCSVAGAVIRRCNDRYPIDEFDGDIVKDITEDEVIIDTDAVLTTGTEVYYYAAFPYTTQGVYSINPRNRATVNGVINPGGSDIPTYIFGYDLDTTDSDPSTRVTYPEDVDNTEYTAAYMNYSTGIFNYGSWNIAPGEKFMPRPCMLKYDGTVDHYLDPNDYTKKEDGTASSVANTSFGGNAMMEWPKIYAKRWEENGIYHFRCSNAKIDDDYECWCNYDSNNNEIDHFYTAIYNSSNISNRLRSISGQTLATGMSISTTTTYATANGGDWYIEVLADRLLIQDLLVMMAKNTNGQVAYGYGYSGGSPAIKPGTMNTKGMFWGDSSVSNGVKVFGMENWWGNLIRRVAGWIYTGGVQKVKLTRGTKDGSTVTDYNANGNGYISLDDAYLKTDETGYISKMKVKPFGRIPVEVSGSATTYEADTLMSDSSIVAYAAVGGAYSGSAANGPFHTRLSSTGSTTTSTFTAVISCKPSAK